jgi:hypothetical protein
MKTSILAISLLLPRIAFHTASLPGARGIAGT